MKKVCIVGAGAVGGLIGARLAAAGKAEVSAIARGATLAALREHGWRLQSPDGDVQTPALASDEPRELGPQDLVVVAVKGPALAAVAPTLAPLLGPQTIVMPAMNGVPWWFCRDVSGVEEIALESVDAGGAIAAAIPLAQVLGCVVYVSAAIAEPGRIVHRFDQRLVIGEPKGGMSSRTDAVVELMRHAGFDAKASADIRHDIWFKLWGNLTVNPVSAITGATGDRILADPLVRAFCSAAMREAAAIGERIGCPIAQTPEERHTVTAKLGAFRTSMLQDVEAGRPIELDAIVGAVHEIGLRLGIATPSIDALLGLTRLFGRVRGLYPAA